MDKSEIDRLLRLLVAADAPSGREDQAGAVVQHWCRRYADEVRVDVLGNIIAVRHGPRSGAATTAPGCLMLAAHMDEIGLVVAGIDRGFLLVEAIGGVDARSLVGQEVTVYATGPAARDYASVHPGSGLANPSPLGPGFPGYVGTRPPHVIPPSERTNLIPLSDLRVDLGWPAGDDVVPAATLALASPDTTRGGRRRGGLPRLEDLVRVGDVIVARGDYSEMMGGRVASKALDNRAGVAAILAALGYLAGLHHTWDVVVVATVQEENGVRGAITAGYGMAPDLAIAVDTTFGDTPGQDDRHTCEMAHGPAIGWGPNLHPGVVRLLRNAAEAAEIPYLNEPLSGNTGTDAWPIQVARGGIPTGLVSIPIRYMHSASEVGVLADLDRTARLLAAFAAGLDEGVLARLPEEV